MASPGNLEKYDSALLGILQHEGNLEPFLDIMFGFLFRKTDFYHVTSETQKRYGFPEGVAEKMIKKHFDKYKNLTAKLVKEAEEIKKRKEANKEQNKVVDENDHADASPKEEKETASSDVSTLTISDTAQAKDSEELPKSQEAFQSNPESYNGAMRDEYSWSQNYDDVDIIVPVDRKITKGRQIQVKIERKTLFVSITHDDGKVDTIIDGKLKHEINREDSMWSLEAGKSVNITLTKDPKIWWKALLTNEEEIDLQKITPERQMTDMAEDEIAVINKLQFDEKQKRLGLPQSHELKVHDMLKKGWNAEGSPFKGQEFDPKMFNISPNAVQ